MIASLARFLAIVRKEFIQMRRDRLTFAMMVGIPIIQLTLFGFAINTDPKQLPTAVLMADASPHARTILASMMASGYFRITALPVSERESNDLIARGEVQFALTIPENFGRKLERGERPALLMEVDASDPAATSNALAALASIGNLALNRDLKGPLANLAQPAAPFEVRVHRHYNPEGITQYNIVPGLMGVILQMTMVMMTAVAITRERERGTMENLLAMPVEPLEVMLGKIVPYILIAYVQVALILLFAWRIFEVPIVGSVALLLTAVLVFVVSMLSVGILFSTMAKNQMQAMQMTFFFFLPSLLLSGFMFPFRGMPGWAQWLGDLLPLTHFLRIVRGILLKGNGWPEVWPNLWPLLAFTLVVIALGLARFRRTLD